MFGELEDSDIYVNNQNFSFEEQPNAEQQAVSPSEEGVQEENQGKKVFGYVLILLFLLVCAGGYYFYNTQQEAKMAEVPGEQNTQEMGDYFYNQANGELTEEQKQKIEQANEIMAKAEANLAEADAVIADSNAKLAKVQKDLTNQQDTVVLDVDLGSPEKAQKPVQAAAPAESKAVAGPKIAQKIEENKNIEKEKSNLIPSATNKQVMFTVASGGRIDPFMPFKQRDTSAGAPKFDVIGPPTELPEVDLSAEELMATKISGIMYDAMRPSAIINFDGTDHLVHKGDMVKGYSILDITKDRVVLKLGTNIYRAAVGQQVEDSVKFNEVSNVSRQFGGAYSKSNGLIEIKPIN